MSSEVELCNIDECRLVEGHSGRHKTYPNSAWAFMEDKDKNKLTKAGFATPRGGKKGAYQNHVRRYNKVIIPYERYDDINFDIYENGYVIRLYPDQYFDVEGNVKQEVLEKDIVIGGNSFILYRTHESLEKHPPLGDWEVRYLEKNGERVESRVSGVEDHGHYVTRISKLGEKERDERGPPQGIFTPEYATGKTDYLCRCVLAWLIVHTNNSPYTSNQANHIKSILEKERLFDITRLEYQGIIRHGMTTCPLCYKILNYDELHSTINFDDETALENAGVQVEGATRSTLVNLFHLEPIVYEKITHIPTNVAWGHAICNTRLGQRRCFSLEELLSMNLKVGIISEGGVDTFGWISKDMTFIRGPNGSVWIRISEPYENARP